MNSKNLERSNINQIEDNYIKLNRNLYKDNFDDKVKVKTWIRTLLYSYRIFPRIIDIIDKIIEERASELSFLNNIYNNSNNPESQFDLVINMSERKNKLVNIYVMTKKLFENLSEKNFELAYKKFCKSITNEELAKEYNISTRSIFRKINDIIDSLYCYTLRNNWSLHFIELQVEEEDWLIEKYNYYLNEFAIDSFKN